MKYICSELLNTRHAPALGLRHRRSNRGSAITEFAPALFIFIMVFFFPFLNLIGMAISYADCLYLDTLLLRQAAIENVLTLDNSTTPPALKPDLSCSTSPTGSLNMIINNWLQLGLGRFASTATVPLQTCYIDLTEGSNKVRFIHLNLQTECRPFLQIPFPLPIPGLNKPVTFRFSGRAVIENIPS
ncbi:hypothetical protein KBI23_08955 [bacterium]|nr:hypothetical protein [bacterium]MBP9809244.1 hypothetical protein [bacterium]